MSESGQKGCIVYLHHTKPHFSNPFLVSKRVNLKKSLQLKLYIMAVWLAYVFNENVDQIDRKWYMSAFRNREILLFLLFS